MNIDEVVLNFTPGTLVILNVVLGLIMFGIALDTSPDDFKVVFRHPKPFIIAILAQLLVLPAVTFGLTLVLPVTASMALGMILVACCPPGNISQVLTHRSGGNVAPVSYTHLDVYKRQMYESAHLISSRTTTEFAEFAMRTTVDYPGHRVLKRYFDDYADAFSLRDSFRFSSQVTRIEPAEQGGWSLTAVGPDGETTRPYRGVILANGTLAEPNVPHFAGDFSGEIMHTSEYLSPSQLAGKRVLIIGAGNSGCDIAVDAVHHAESIDMSVRRGYYFCLLYTSRCV